MSTASNRVAPVVAGFDVGRVREEFPILRQLVHGKPLVYLDNAATTQKPQAVLDALNRFYLYECSNVHRGVHYLSELATQRYDNARITVQKFLNAAEARQIVFVRGTTEAISLVAHSWGRANVRPGYEIVISAMEPLSTIAPGQILCQQTAAHLRVIPMSAAVELLIKEYEKLRGPRTRLVA